METQGSTTDLMVRVDGLPTFVRVRGNGRPVLLLHGGGPGTSGNGWLDLLSHWSPAAQIFAPDFPGFGKSEGRADLAGSESFVAFSVALLRELCLESVVVIGHSMGAAVAAALAKQRSDLVSRLVLIAPGGGLYGLRYESPGIQLMEKAGLEPTRANLQDLVELMSSRPDTYQKQVDARWNLMQRPGVPDMQRRMAEARRAGRSETTAAPRAMRAAQMKNLPQPVALIWGQFERFNPVDLGRQILSQLPPHASYHEIADAGHNVHYDNPRAVAAVLSTFLDR